MPVGYEATAGETATATQHNSPLEDLQTDANTARPIVAGGTGATSAAAALTNLGALPRAGGAMTGNLTVLEVTETEVETSSTTVALNAALGTRLELTLTAATTLTDDLEDGQHISLRVINGETYTLSYPAGTLWVGGAAPVLEGDDRVTFEKWGADLIGYAGLGIG